MLYTNISDRTVRVTWGHAVGQPLRALEVEPGEVVEGPGGAYVEYFRRESFGALAVAPEGAVIGKPAKAPAAEEPAPAQVTLSKKRK